MTSGISHGMLQESVADMTDYTKLYTMPLEVELVRMHENLPIMRCAYIALMS